jgi:eukaryotic-like serine/threonine-protein kinase
MGGMAETFLAVKRGPAGFERRVCLKRVLPARAADERFLEQFWDEARLLSHLHHPGIVQVHDFGETDGTYYMALELVEGSDLERLTSSLRQAHKLFPETLALYVTGELLSALHYAHCLELEGEALGIVHRDISPSNILISKHGDVKLTDFGIAKFRSRRHKTETGYVKGKIAYMSPEQVRGDELDARSDIFSVGVLLHEIITGVHPFDAATDITLLSNILTGNRPELRSLLPNAPSELVVLIDALLQVERDKRPASAVDALRLIPSGGPEFELKRDLSALVAEAEQLELASSLSRREQARARSPSTPPSALRQEDVNTAPLERAHEPEPDAERDAERMSEPPAARSLELAKTATAPPRASSTSRAPRAWLLALALGVLALALGVLFKLSAPTARLPSALPTVRAPIEPAPSAVPEQRAVSPSPSPAASSTPAQPATPSPHVDAASTERAAQVGQPASTDDARKASDNRRSRRSRVRPAEPASSRGESPPAQPAVAPTANPPPAKRPLGRSGASVTVDDF